MYDYQLTDAAYRDGSHYGIHSIMDFVKRGPRYFYGRHISGLIQDEEHKALTIGRAAHCYTLDGAKVYDANFIQQPEMYPDKKGGAKPWHGGAGYCKDWINKQRDAGKQPISIADESLIMDMDASVRMHPLASQLLQRGKGIPEVTVRHQWQVDPYTVELPLQCRADWIVGGTDPDTWTAIVDYKTVANMQDFKRQVWSYGYWWQSSFYRSMIHRVCGKWLPFYFVACEKQASHRCDVFKVPDEIGLKAANGDKGWGSVLENIAWCMAEDTWPNHASDDVIELFTPERIWEGDGAL